MSLALELFEYTQEDEKIIKSFKTKDSLCMDIFLKENGEYIMDPSIREQLLEISNDFLDSLGIDFFIHDIILTGSLANYNWSEYSDVDIHLLIDFKEIDVNQELIKEFFDAKKSIWNEKHNVKIKNFDVEIYVQDVDEKHVSSGVYSILNDLWIIEPEKTIHSIEDEKILNKGEQYAKTIDKLIKMGENENVIRKIEQLRKKLKSFRQTGLESGGEFSYENLTFKLLRRNGYIKKLMDFKNSIIDKKLSLR
jgi:hypothetical protein